MLLNLPDLETRARRSADLRNAIGAGLEDARPRRRTLAGRASSETVAVGTIGRPREVPATMVHAVQCFDGFSLVTVDSGGRPMWLGFEIAAILGLGDVRTLLGLLARQWVERCPPNVLRIVDGHARTELLERLERAQVVVAAAHRRRPLALLTSEAIDELVACQDSALGRRFRRHLRERVVPEFHAHQRAARALARPLLTTHDATIARNALELERRCFHAAVLERLVDRLEADGLGDVEDRLAHRVVASELALGGSLAEHAERLTHGWATPAQIAERWSELSPIRVGRVIADLGLKGAHSRAVLTKARGHERTVISHVYSPSAVTLIERELASRGFRRRAQETRP